MQRQSWKQVTVRQLEEVPLNEQSTVISPLHVKTQHGEHSMSSEICLHCSGHVLRRLSPNCIPDTNCACRVRTDPEHCPDSKCADRVRTTFRTRSAHFQSEDCPGHEMRGSCPEHSRIVSGAQSVLEMRGLCPECCSDTIRAFRVRRLLRTRNARIVSGAQSVLEMRRSCPNNIPDTIRAFRVRRLLRTRNARIVSGAQSVLEMRGLCPNNSPDTICAFRVRRLLRTRSAHFVSGAVSAD